MARTRNPSTRFANDVKYQLGEVNSWYLRPIKIKKSKNI